MILASKIKNNVYLLLIYLLCTQSALAAKVDVNDKTWGQFYNTVLALFTGTPAVIVCLIALAAGLLGAIFTQQKLMYLSAGIAIPFAIQFGPPIFIGLSGAVL